MSVNWATPLYKFLRMCNANPLPKEVLDCGAGGSEPPLAIFYEHGYQTYGVEIAEEPLLEAQGFCAEKSMALNIIRGDMRCIPFPDERFSFVFSYNAIDFMTKPDIAVSLREIGRVLRPGGLLYVNVLSVDDARSFQPFRDTGPDAELYRSKEFAHFEDEELDGYLSGLEIVRKEKRFVEIAEEGEREKQADLKYIARKRPMPPALELP